MPKGRNKAAVSLGIVSFLFLLVPDAATAVWAGVMTYIIVKIVAAVCGIRVGDEEEMEGLDITTHGERGYNL